MNGVHVIVASYGDVEWHDRGQRAAASASEQSETPEWVTVRHVPGEADLAEVRNDAAAARPAAEWLIFLDADDRLDDGYVEAMLNGTGDIRQPATAGVHADGRVEPSALIPERDLLDGNYIVIGAMIRKAAFDEVGGFRSLPIYEDWDLWLRLEEHGCTVGQVPDAVYYVTVRPDSRNNQSVSIQRRWATRIKNDALERRRATA